MVLLYNNATIDAADVTIEWLETWSDAATAVLLLIPFAGIAFLWFTGVMRDLMGDLEDKFFSTVFLGSGIILVVLLYIWAGTLGAIFGTLEAGADLSLDNDIYIFGLQFMDKVIGNFFLRMAAVYMLSIGSLWTRTDAVPRWLVIVTLIVGVVFLLFAAALKWARFIFPAWVMLVSVYILVLNYRRTRENEGNEQLTLDA